ncbi:thioredoxin domain-containing protein [Saccharibacter floricola]|uniref:Thiol:disulfide interchange protein n=1 Tax=Saccharibacter floricola DSM 15669 TaxID=1123227 RepID=A0ABQ0NZI6_9PROT|nr:thioredoxin domain-containing protein [Saccharibacter floricola]GBQ04812.1 thiol:disulfide interchange protein [Saccharibacter floricola DSM 15669]
MTQRLLSRRAMLGALPAFAASTQFARAAETPDTRFTPRIIGNPHAPVLVQEWFSLTCTHCAHFATDVFPEVRKKFIDTGKIRYQFHDFPLDQIGLIAAAVARSLPEERYEPFIMSLFSRLQQWAFSSNDPIEHLRQEAALAGMAPSRFDAIRNDQTLAKALYEQSQNDGRIYSIQGTPYFRFNDKPFAQDPETIEKFAELVRNA